MITRGIFVGALLAIAPVSLAAQPTPGTNATDMDARLEIARELTELSRAEEQLDLVFERMKPSSVADLLANLERMSPGRDIGEQIETRYPGGRQAFEDEFSRRYADQFRSQYPEIVDQIARYWADNMTLEQLEATAEFFRTDLGGVWVGLLPGVYQHMTGLGREYSLQAGIAVAGEMMNAMDSGTETPDGGEVE
ncbi:MAG: hypothetical protein RLN87_01115 [Parasphingopyxis sp.]|uniref:DUF2059 domain-containing protein n=1 Tax=Parasphingopyxis sp. TaxID=1920299 RepID=UPI0032EF95A1